MRYVSFDDNNKDIYELIYDGFLLHPGGVKGKAEVRLTAKVFDKLDEVGEPVRRNDLETMRLKPGAHVVPLEDAEYDHLVKCLSEVSWTPRVVKRANAAFDLLENAPTKPGVTLAAE